MWRYILHSCECVPKSFWRCLLELLGSVILSLVGSACQSIPSQPNHLMIGIEGNTILSIILVADSEYQLIPYVGGDRYGLVTQTDDAIAITEFG